MKYSFLILFLAIINFSFAQSSDLVKLKDGTVIKGEIVEYRVDQYVKIKTAEGNILEFPFEDISKTKIHHAVKVPIPTKGFFNNTSMGILMGTEDNVSPRINFHTVNGYQINQRMLTGIGFGVDRYKRNYYGSSNDLVFPLYANFTYLLRKSDVAPFVSVRGGYSFNFSKKNSALNNADYLYYVPENRYGGIHSGIQVGIRNYTKSNLGYTLSAGYTFQQTKSSYSNSFWNGEDYVYQPIKSKSYHHRFEIKLGIIIN